MKAPNAQAANTQLLVAPSVAGNPPTFFPLNNIPQIGQVTGSVSDAC
jgi:hypothetical protein